MSRFPGLELAAMAFGLQRALEEAIVQGRFDDATLALLREAGMRAIANAEPQGVPIEDQAEIGREAIQHFHQFFEKAVTRARERDE